MLVLYVVWDRLDTAAPFKDLQTHAIHNCHFPHWEQRFKLKPLGTIALKSAKTKYLGCHRQKTRYHSSSTSTAGKVFFMSGAVSPNMHLLPIPLCSTANCYFQAMSVCSRGHSCLLRISQQAIIHSLSLYFILQQEWHQLWRFSKMGSVFFSTLKDLEQSCFSGKSFTTRKVPGP